ncbi:MAG: phenylpyruvate tautomerase MIF-related protein [Gammaproteobacteria bacterium]|nr:phenylpyruvate tautomerase MIF-related protein [Gammaproteobacteria bacterium]MCF6229710.1 phenylpyruvate tautomerase MIF-related protein [Gammaproteobacteria bacterium]
MPLLTIKTNRSLTTEEQKSVLSHASALVATLLEKPESYVMVLLQTEQSLMLAGNPQPCALLELKSLGLPEEKTAEFSKSLCEMVKQQLQIPSNRVYIEFSNPARHLWGWDSRTF